VSSSWLDVPGHPAVLEDDPPNAGADAVAKPLKRLMGGRGGALSSGAEHPGLIHSVDAQLPAQRVVELDVAPTRRLREARWQRRTRAIRKGPSRGRSFGTTGGMVQVHTSDTAQCPLAFGR
jgi:hypothetical protein